MTQAQAGKHRFLRIGEQGQDRFFDWTTSWTSHEGLWGEAPFLGQIATPAPETVIALNHAVSFACIAGYFPVALTHRPQVY